MYGLYLEAVNDYINESYGEDVWRLIENRAEIPHLKFVRHQMYKYVFLLWTVLGLSRTMFWLSQLKHQQTKDWQKTETH